MGEAIHVSSRWDKLRGGLLGGTPGSGSYRDSGPQGLTALRSLRRVAVR